MSLAKKMLSVSIASIMAMSAIGIGTTAFAEPINTIQSASTISLNESKTVTFKYGDIGDYDYISQDTVYYKFTAPSTGYYEFSLTGYKARTDNNDPSAYIDIANESGVVIPSSGGLYNPYFNDLKSVAYLEQGKTYIVSEFYTPAGTDEYTQKGYTETPITLTVTQHTHDFSKIVNDGYTDYTCKRCYYSYTEFNPVSSTPTQGPTVSKPKAAKIKKVKAAKKAVAVTWNKVSGVSGYEVQVATDKKFKKNKKTVTIKKQKATSTTVKKLKAKKKYYVRVRTYKTVNGKKVYSAWSSVKNVKTK